MKQHFACSKEVKLTDKAKNLRFLSKRKVELNKIEAQLSMTFGDLDGRKGSFPPGCTMRPSKQLLALHATAAWLEFDKNRRIPPPRYDSSSDLLNDEETMKIMDAFKK